MAAIRREDITGLVLAGGRGSRMGGVDKGLQPFHGVPLALHAIRRLAPQVGGVMVSANRHLDRYAGFGVPVWADHGPRGDDGLPAYEGPLAGFLTGLQRCATPYLATVPCDSPQFPIDLVARLADALAKAAPAADIVMATAPSAGGGEPAAVHVDGRRRQPVFCLMRVTVVDGLLRCLQGGERRVGRWTAGHHCVDVPFDDAAAFVNANTLDELVRLQAAATAAEPMPP